MSNIDLIRLAANGRAFDATRAWTNEENDALYRLVRERNLSREQAAGFIRAGALTLDAYDKAIEENLVPVRTEAVHKLVSSEEPKEETPKVVKKGKGKAKNI